MASSQLRRAETREYGQDPPVGILSLRDVELHSRPRHRSRNAMARLYQLPGAAPAPTEPEQLGLFRNRG